MTFYSSFPRASGSWDSTLISSCHDDLDFSKFLDPHELYLPGTQAAYLGLDTIGYPSHRSDILEPGSLPHQSPTLSTQTYPLTSTGTASPSPTHLSSGIPSSAYLSAPSTFATPSRDLPNYSLGSLGSMSRSLVKSGVCNGCGSFSTPSIVPAGVHPSLLRRPPSDWALTLYGADSGAGRSAQLSGHRETRKPSSYNRKKRQKALCPYCYRSYNRKVDLKRHLNCNPCRFRKYALTHGALKTMEEENPYFQDGPGSDWIQRIPLSRVLGLPPIVNRMTSHEQERLYEQRRQQAYDASLPTA